MNVLEHEMISVLTELKEKYGVFEIKAEFESEGSRMEELMRLKDITSAVGIPIILKIGGVEAVSDVYNGLALGVKGIVAPMAETAYAVSKFTDLISNYIAKDNADDIDFAINIETITAHKNLDKMLSVSNISNLSSITVGRVDLVGSMGLDRSSINQSEKVENICRDIYVKAKKHSLNTALGGGIEKEALSFINRLKSENLIDKYETRKVVFPAESNIYGEKAILKAVEFELLWLKSKERYYSRIKLEDKSRIEMLEKRLA